MNTQQNRCWLTTIGTLSLLLFCLNSSLVTASSCTELRVGGFRWAPVYIPPTNTKPASGLGLDLLKSISLQLKVTYKINQGSPFARELQQLVSGQLDIILGIYLTPERQTVFDFSIPFYREPMHVFSRVADNHTIKLLSDLEGLVGIVLRGSSYGSILDEYLSTRATAFKVSTTDQQINMLLAKRADYFISTPVEAINRLKKLNKKDQVRMSKKALSWADVRMAFSKLSPCKHLIPDINSIILKDFLPDS